MSRKHLFGGCIQVHINHLSKQSCKVVYSETKQVKLELLH